MKPRYYRIADLATTPSRGGIPARRGRYPVSAATIWRWVKIGEFPPPTKLGPRTTAWPADVLDQWDRSRPAQAGG